MSVLLFVDHIAFSDSLCRTCVSAFSAGCALAVVNDCMIVFNMYSVVLAGFFAFFTSNTSVFADASCYFAYIRRAAAYIDLLVNVTQNDKMIGTCLCTDTASDTFGFVNSCKTVLDDYSILRTDLGAVSESETAVSTYL